MKSIKVCEYSRSRSFHDDLILQDQASGELSQDHWSSGSFFGAKNSKNTIFCGEIFIFYSLKKSLYSAWAKFRNDWCVLVYKNHHLYIYLLSTIRRVIFIVRIFACGIIPAFITSLFLGWPCGTVIIIT